VFLMSSHSCAVSLISFVLCVSSHRVSSYMCVCIHLASPSHASSTSTSTFPTPSSSPIPFHFPFPSPLRPPSLDPLCAPSLSPPRRVATAGRGERNKLQFSQARPQTQRPQPHSQRPPICRTRRQRNWHGRPCALCHWAV